MRKAAPSVALGLLVALACSDSGREGFRPPSREVRVPATAEAVRQVFDAQGYRLEDVRRTGIAPRIYVRAIPRDMASIEEVDEKKRLFIRTLLPLVLKANEEIGAQRARLLALHGQASPAPRDVEWLTQLAAAYGGSPDDTAELLVRVDVVPVSLALAQGIDESGWGTSRFARADESLFGQHARPSSENAVDSKSSAVQVEGYADLLDSVRSYLLNLNSGHAYHRLRQERAALTRAGQRPSGLALVDTLRDYSERGGDYLADLRAIIEANGLHAYDTVRLATIGGSLRVVPAL